MVESIDDTPYELLRSLGEETPLFSQTCYTKNSASQWWPPEQLLQMQFG